ncbi:MAG: carboxypeptidase-like regulatory domain-containing protein, partial [Aurantibacter sp.]
MKSILVILLLWICTTGYSQTEITVSGRVTDGRNLLPDVTVIIEGTDQGTKTDHEGRYKIEVMVGQVLQFSHLGMLPVQVITEDVTTFLNITMYPKIDELDEVVVEKRKRSQK